jgi:hypothetical protein
MIDPPIILGIHADGNNDIPRLRRPFHVRYAYLPRVSGQSLFRIMARDWA